MRKILLNILQEAQDEHGYLSEHILKQISIEQNVPLAQLYGIVKFYSMLRTEPQGRHIIEICGSPSCTLNGGVLLEKFLEDELKVKIGEKTKDGFFSLYKTSCIGCCNEAPAMLIDGRPYTKLTESRILRILKKLREENNADTSADKP